MIKNISKLFLTSIVCMLFINSAYACKCSESNEIKDTVAADIVVLAKALERRALKRSELSATLVSQKFIVEKIYKDIPKEKERGAMLIRRPFVGKEITVLQEPDNCLFPFEAGKIYKIFGRLEEGNKADYTRLVTNKCSGTRLHKAASVNTCDSNTVFSARNTLLDFKNISKSAVKIALGRVFECYTLVPGVEERLVDNKTGERFTSIDHRIKELNLILYFSRGELVGVSEISPGLIK